jgi:Flp pilus assembly protein TadD
MARLWILALFSWAALGQDLLSTGRRAFEAGDFARAEALFREHLKAFPNSAEAMSNLAAIHSRRGEFAQAVELYGKALRADPKLVQIQFNLGVAHLRAGHHREAIASLRAFLKSHPKETRARELLGLSLVETGDLKQAIEELETVVQQAPGQSSAVFSLAYAHSRSGDMEKGSALLARLESHPAQARLIEGLIEFRRERYGAAKSLFEQSLQNEPNFAPAHAALGRLYLFQNQDEPATAHLEKALKLSPHNPEVCYQLGVLRDRSGNTGEARSLFDRSLQLRAENPGPLYALAKIDLRENRPAAAIARLEKAARLAPQADAIQLLLGRAYQAAGESAKAKLAFAEVRRLQQSRLDKQREALDSQLVLDPER